MPRFLLLAAAFLAVTSSNWWASVVGVAMPVDQTVQLVIVGLSMGAVWAASA